MGKKKRMRKNKRNRFAERTRKAHSEGLPPRVYRNGKGFRTSIWTGTKNIYYPTVPCPEQAHYIGLVGENGHHWEGMKEGPYFGFTYIITNKKTGKRYVGKKQFYLWDGPTGGHQCHDMRSEWWDEKAWRPNDWKFYTGSQRDLNKEIEDGNIWDFKYEVLEMCYTKLDLHLSEVNKMIEEDVLEAVNEKGEYLWYNKNIAGLEYRPPFRKSEVASLIESSREAMRVYYLKPNVCPICTEAIPYGAGGCYQCSQPSTVSLETPRGGFKDVR